MQAGNVFQFVPDISSATSSASDIIDLLDTQPTIDAIGWIVTKVTHQLDDGGYTTALECETSGGDYETLASS